MSKNIDCKVQLIEDKNIMKLVLELAKKGKGRVNPNPLVAAVIVHKGEIIGQGYHQIYGESHAEISALRNVKEPLKDATLYVNLEPCSHQGRTPSCAKEIIKHSIKRVVIANVDPNPLVSGRGIEILKQAGLQVDVGILSKEAKKVNKIFFKYIQNKRPYVMIKSAMSLDGKIATHTGQSKWISSEQSRALVHDLRHQYSAILTGVNTIIMDDPILNTRNENSKPSHPFRIILDPKGRIPMESAVLNTPQFGEPILIVSEKTDRSSLSNLKDKKVRMIACPEIDHKIDLNFLLKKLGELNLDSIMVEAGGNTNFECIKQNIVDKLMLFISPQIIGGKDSLTAFEGLGFEKLAETQKFKSIDYKSIGSDLLIEAEI